MSLSNEGLELLRLSGRRRASPDMQLLTGFRRMGLYLAVLSQKMLEGQGYKKISVPLFRTNFKCRVAQCDDELADCRVDFIYIAIHRHERTSLFLQQSLPVNFLSS